MDRAVRVSNLPGAAPARARLAARSRLFSADRLEVEIRLIAVQPQRVCDGLGRARKGPAASASLKTFQWASTISSSQALHIRHWRPFGSPLQEMGAMALALLIRKLANDESVGNVRVRPELICRMSSCPPSSVCSRDLRRHKSRGSH